MRGDARTVRLPDAGDYRLAFIPLNSIFLMGTRADQAAAVATLAAHLAPGGLAVVDAWLPDADDLARYDGRLVLEWVREDPATGRTVTKTGSAVYDAATASVRLTTIFEEGHAGEPPVRWVRVDRLAPRRRPTSSWRSPRRPGSSSRRSPATTTWASSSWARSASSWSPGEP